MDQTQCHCQGEETWFAVFVGGAIADPPKFDLAEEGPDVLRGLAVETGVEIVLELEVFGQLVNGGFDGIVSPLDDDPAQFTQLLLELVLEEVGGWGVDGFAAERLGEFQDCSESGGDGVIERGKSVFLVVGAFGSAGNWGGQEHQQIRRVAHVAFLRLCGCGRQNKRKERRIFSTPIASRTRRTGVASGGEGLGNRLVFEVSAGAEAVVGGFINGRVMGQFRQGTHQNP